MSRKRRGPDRRVQKTRNLLRDALISLILERKYETIVVQDILDRANVGRSTFYAHFDGKDDLFQSGFEALGAMLRAAQSVGAPAPAKSQDRIISFSLPMFEHALQHRRIYKATIGSPVGIVVRDHLERVIVGLIAAEFDKEMLRRRKAAGGIPVDLYVKCLASVFMSVMVWWMEQRSPLEPVKINEAFRALALPMLNAMMAGA